jgi:hypothetical protein
MFHVKRDLCASVFLRLSWGAVDDSLGSIGFWEGIMGVRRIGQEVLRFEAKVRPTSLDELHALLNWAPAERALASL